MRKSPEIKGALMIFFSMGIFGIVGSLIRIIELPPNVIMGITSAIASVILAFVLIYRREFKFYNPVLLVFSGILTIVVVLCFFMSYTLTTMSNTIFTHYIAPVFTALIAPFVLREKLGWKSLAALGLSIIGLFFITFNGLGFDSRNLLGIVLGIVSGVFYGIAIVVNKIVIEKNSPYQIMFAQSVIPAVILLPTVFFSDFSLEMYKIGILFFQAIFIYISASVLYLYGMKFLASHKSAIISYAEILFTLLYAFVFFREIPAFSSIIGGVLIVGGGVLLVS